MEDGAEISLCDASSSYTGADWGEDGDIIASLSVTGGLSRVPSGGGTPTPVTELAGGERTHRFPQILPGGKAILFTVENFIVGFDDASIEVLTLTDHRRKTLQRGGTFGRYLAASGGKGYLTYVNRGTMFAVPFDPEKLETHGSPMSLRDKGGAPGGQIVRSEVINPDERELPFDLLEQSHYRHQRSIHKYSTADNNQ